MDRRVPSVIDLARSDGISRDRIGAKAESLVSLRRHGLRVPDGFVVCTEVCRDHRRTGRIDPTVRTQLLDALGRLERSSGRRWGSSPSGLTVSVRSGAAVSMPGMMTTVLGVDGIENVMRGLEVVFSSWDSDPARGYRELHGIDHDLGTAAIVQVMVHGDRDDDSGAGVAFSRDPSTGIRGMVGDWLPAERGDGVVDGTATPLPIDDLARRHPEVHRELDGAAKLLESATGDLVDVEFVVESGTLHFLQFRRGQRSAAAAVRVAVDLVDEGAITPAEAAERVSDLQLVRAATPVVDRRHAPAPLTSGLGASPGVASGALCTAPDRVTELAARTGSVVLVRDATSPADLHGMLGATGLLTRLGGPLSHAALVARELDLPAVVGAESVAVDEASGAATISGVRFAEGDVVTIDGSTGEVWAGVVPASDPAPDDHRRRLGAWKATG